MKKIFSFLIVLLFVFCAPYHAYCEINKEKIVFALVLDQQGSRFHPDAEGIKNAVNEVAGFSRETVFPEKYVLNFQFDSGSIEASAKELLKDKNVDIIIAAGAQAASFFSRMTVLEKPVIALCSGGYEIFFRDFESRVSDRGNFFYIKPYPSVFSAAETFQELAGFKKIELIAEPWLAEIARDALKEDSKEKNCSISVVEAKDSPLETIEELDEKTEAVIILPLYSYSWKDFEFLVKELNKKKIYTFSLSGGKEVEQGCLAGIKNSFSHEKVLRAAGAAAEKIISGKSEKIKSGPFLNGPELEINMDTARRLGVSPDFNLLLKAFPYYGEADSKKNLIKFKDVINFSIENNLILLASGKERIKSEFDRNIAESHILPQAGIMAEGIVRDEYSAYSSFGQYPEKEVNLKFYIRQAVFDDEAFTGVSRSKKALLAAMEKERAKKLETAADTASAYFRYLSAVKLRKIRRNDLELSMANLSRAETKYEIGTKGPGDVYRWESRTADAKKELLNALKKENQAFVRLEKITGKKFSEDSVFGFPELDSDVFWIDEKTFSEMAKNRASIERGKKILGEFAIENSPELSAYSKLVEAQEEHYKYLKRKHFVPKVYLKGEYLQRVGRSGAASDGVSFDLAPGVPPFVIEEPKDNSWQVGVEAVLPIFTGLRDKNTALKADQELKRLELVREDTLESIEENIRLLVEEASSAYLGISFAEESKSAAEKNFDLVSDAYELGLADSVDLIDAQHSLTSADEVLAASLYDFMEKIYLIQARLGFEDFSDVPDKKEKIIELIGGKQ